MCHRHVRCTGFKLMRRRKDGSLGSLYVDRKARIPVGEWLTAAAHDTSKIGLAFRPGWHCTLQPSAPHLKLTEERVWVRVELLDYEVMVRPPSQGGEWLLGRKMRVLEILDE